MQCTCRNAAVRATPAFIPGIWLEQLEMRGILMFREDVLVAILLEGPLVLALLANATRPAALSTTLIMVTGVMQTKRDGLSIIAAVLMMVAIGAPVRRWHQNHARARKQVVELHDPERHVPSVL